MKVLLILALATVAVSNAIPTDTQITDEDTHMKSVQGDSDFNAGLRMERSRFHVTNYDGVDAYFRHHMTDIADSGVRRYGTSNWLKLAKHFRRHLEINYPGKSWTCLAAKTLAYSARGYDKFFRMDVDDIEVFCQQH